MPNKRKNGYARARWPAVRAAGIEQQNHRQNGEAAEPGRWHVGVFAARLVRQVIDNLLIRCAGGEGPQADSKDRDDSNITDVRHRAKDSVDLAIGMREAPCLRR